MKRTFHIARSIPALIVNKGVPLAASMNVNTPGDRMVSSPHGTTISTDPRFGITISRGSADLRSVPSPTIVITVAFSPGSPRRKAAKAGRKVAGKSRAPKPA